MNPVEKKGKILVMDDQPYIRELFQAVLAQIGYETVVVGHGEEAVDLYQKAREARQPFDAVILDLSVDQGMGGKETLEQLRGIHPAVKAIAISGSPDDPIITQYRLHGFRAVLHKPYKIVELSQILQQVVSNE